MSGGSDVAATATASDIGSTSTSTPLPTITITNGGNNGNGASISSTNGHDTSMNDASPAPVSPATAVPPPSLTGTTPSQSSSQAQSSPTPIATSSSSPSTTGTGAGIPVVGAPLTTIATRPTGLPRPTLLSAGLANGNGTSPGGEGGKISFHHHTHSSTNIPNPYATTATTGGSPSSPIPSSTLSPSSPTAGVRIAPITVGGSSVANGAPLSPGSTLLSPAPTSSSVPSSSSIAEEEQRLLTDNTYSLLSVLKLVRTEKPDQEDRIQRDQKERSVMKQGIVVEGRKNVNLERDLGVFEKKITAFIRKREGVSDDEVGRMLTQLDADESMLITPTLADLLQRYGNLLFFMHQEPDYLVRLLKAVYGPDVEPLVSTVTFTLYANPFDVSEELLLLQSMQTILKQTFDQCTDITTFLRDNSAAPKLLSAYTRREPCQTVLRDTLSAPMTKLMSETKLNLEINPAKILEQLLAEGKAPPQGIDAPEIMDIVNTRVNQLLAVCDSFLKPIYACDLPLGFRLICKMLRELGQSSSHTGATGAHIADSLVGGFVFLRFFNPAVVDPRTVKSNPGTLPTRVRRNMIMVAKVLQNLSNGVLFEKKEAYMKPVNSYLQVQMQSIRTFFQRLTNIPSLNEHLKLDALMERTEPFVYISMREILFLHRLITTHVKAVAPAADDPIHKVLESLKEYEAPSANLDQFVTLRLVNWMSGTHRHGRSVEEPEDDNSKRLRSYLLPVLTGIVRSTSIRVTIRESDPNYKQLFAVLDTAATDAATNKNAHMASQIALVREELKALGLNDEKLKDDEKSRLLEPLINRLGTMLSRRQMLMNKLADEVLKLKTALNVIRAKFSKLRASVEKLKSYLNNASDPATQKLLGSGSLMDDKTPIVVEDRKPPEIQSVLSSSGLIGGLLNKLQRDVAEKIRVHLIDKAPELMFKEETEEGTYEALHFPRTCDFYGTALDTFSTVGKCCIEDMVLMVLNTLPSMTKVNIIDVESKSGNKTVALESTFSWAAFTGLIPTLKMTNQAHLDLLDCVVDLMAVDILTAVLQHFDGSVAPLYPTTLQKLIQLSFLHFQVRQPRKLKKSLWQSVRTAIADRWAVVLGQLCPHYVSPIVAAFKQQFTNPANTGSAQQIMEILRGVRLIRFDTQNDRSMEELGTYLALHVQLQEAHKKKESGTILERTFLEVIRHCLAEVDMSKCESPSPSSASSSSAASAALTSSSGAPAKSDGKEPAKKDSGGAAAAAATAARAQSILASIFTSQIVPMFENCKKRAEKSEELKSHCRLLASTIIMHGPPSFFERHSQDFLVNHLCKGMSKDVKKRCGELKILLHFLRGSSGEYQQQRIKWESGRPKDHIKDVYGLGVNQLSAEALSLMHNKIFMKKGFGKDIQVRRVLERIIVQMAFHNWNYTTTTTLPQFCQAKGVEQLIGLRALEILVDERSGFTEFALRHASGAAARIRLATQISALSSTLLPIVLEVVRSSDAQVGLKAQGVNPVMMIPAFYTNDETEEDSEVNYMKAIAVDSYDVRSEDYQSEEKSLFATRTTRNIFVDIYYQALRLFPKVMPEPLLEATPENTSINGLFIGKLLCHKEKLIARAAFEGLKRCIIAYPTERFAVIQAFLLLIVDESFQEPQSLSTLLTHLNELVSLWIERLGVEHEKKSAFSTPTMAVDDRKRIMSDASSFIDDPFNSWPTWLRWQQFADAVALIYVGHPAITVRTACLDLFKLVQLMNHTYHRVSQLALGISTHAYQPLPKPNAMNPETIHCVGDILDAYGEEIMRDCATYASTNQNLASSTTLLVSSKPIPAFSSIINATPEAIVVAVTLLARKTVKLRRVETLDRARDVLLRFIKKLPPFAGAMPVSAAEEQKMYGALLQEKVALYNSLFFSMLGVAASSKPTHKELVELKENLRGMHERLAEYLNVFWTILDTELPWVYNAVVLSCSSVQHQSMNKLIEHLDNTYRNFNKKKRKNAAALVTAILAAISRSSEFPRGLQYGGLEAFRVLIKFIQQTQKFLWTTKKLVKQKWLNVQLDLVKLVCYVAIALNTIKLGSPNTDGVFFDSNANLSDWNMDARHTLFKWLLQYTKNAHVPNTSPSPAEAKENEQLTRIVRKNVCMALKHLAGLGKVIPDDQAASMLKEDLFTQLIDIDDDGYMLLCVMLCHHFKYLFPIYLDKVYTSTRDIGELYFRAIADVFSCDTKARLTTIKKFPSISDIINAERLALVKKTALQTIGKANLGKLIHLALLQMISNNLHTRFNAFQMIQAVTTDFISAEEGKKLLVYRFAFESHISSWAREYALIISDVIAKAVPSVAFQVFREGCMCIKNRIFQEWIPDLLLSWADHIVLCPLAGVIQWVEEKKPGSPEMDSVNYAIGNLHTSVSFLDKLFSIIVADKVPLNSMLPIYRRLAKVGANVAAILEFMVQRVGTKDAETIPLCKTIMFTIYAEKEHRDRVLLSVTRYLLRVLRQNADQFSKSNLKNRLRGSQILSVLEKHDKEAGSGGSYSIAHDFQEYDCDDTILEKEKFVPGRSLEHDEHDHDGNDTNGDNDGNDSKSPHIPKPGGAKNAGTFSPGMFKQASTATATAATTSPAKTEPQQRNSISLGQGAALVNKDGTPISLANTTPASPKIGVPPLRPSTSASNLLATSVPASPKTASTSVLAGATRAAAPSVSVASTTSGPTSRPTISVTPTPVKQPATPVKTAAAGGAAAAKTAAASPSTKQASDNDGLDLMDADADHTLDDSKGIGAKKEAPGGLPRMTTTGPPAAPTPALETKREEVKPQDKLIEQAQSNVVAAMLVELIGVDYAPVLPYFPCILIYAIIHINDKDKFVRETMHKLLTRLMGAFGEMDASAIMDDEGKSRKYRGPLLQEALRSESLQLIWRATESSKVVSGHDTVVMFADSFIGQFCEEIDKQKPHSIHRIGYESLRWAVLSTKLSISHMAHIMYRSLLKPLNEASMHALTMSLLGSLEDWERQSWYTSGGAGGAARPLTPAAQAAANRSMASILEEDEDFEMLLGGTDRAATARKEAAMIVDTLRAVAEQLMKDNRLHQHPSIFWTAVALLRCDHPSIYNRALELLQCIRGYPFLFHYGRPGAQGHVAPPVLGDDSSVVTAVAPSTSTAASPVLPAEAYILPEDFWTFSEHWSPRFEGIQSYLLQGLLSKQTEANALSHLASLMRVVWDPVVDSSQTRHLTTIMALLPWLYEQINSEQAGVKVVEILHDLSSVIGRFSKGLADTFRSFSDQDKAEKFISQVCSQLAELYFPQYAQAAAEYLTALLQSDFHQYHAIVFKISNMFLVCDHAVDYVKAFDEIIGMAHEAVARIVGSDVDVGALKSVPGGRAKLKRPSTMSTTTPGFGRANSAGSGSPVTIGVSISVATSRDASASIAGGQAPGVLPPSDGRISEYDREVAAPAADVIATVISLLNRKGPSGGKQGKGHHRRTETLAAAMHKGNGTVGRTGAAAGAAKRALAATAGDSLFGEEDERARSISFVNVNVRAMPIRSLRNAIIALQQVVRSSPMFPKTHGAV